MQGLEKVIGTSEDLTVLQMSIRALIIFILAYALLRISGRRSFRLHSPLDNVITILLGAVLSRAVVGASPFGPVVAASLTIVLLHRILAWLNSSFPKTSRFFDGQRILLYDEGRFLTRNLKKGLVNEEEIMHRLRSINQSNNLSKIDSIYMEKDGDITVINKV